VRNLSYILLSALLSLLVACQSSPNKTTSPPTTVPPATAVAADLSVSRRFAKLHFDGFRRYRGTVGSQPVTVELTIAASSDAHDSTVCVGSYTYNRHPAGQLLLYGSRPWRPERPLQLTEADSARPQVPTGRWQANQMVGPVLTGMWSSPSGKQLPFSLREDYTDEQGQLMAVRYEVLDERVEGAACKPEVYEGETKAEYRQRLKDQPTSSLDRQYLHLLDPGAAQPTLRNLQCPSPRERRAAMRAALAEAGGCAALTDNLCVTYNGYGLLAVGEYHEEYYQGTPHANHGVDATIYDLRTGEVLALADILKAGSDQALRQFITHKLRNQMELDASEVLHPAEGDSTTTELPRPGVGLTADGLTFQYSDYELGAYAYGMPAVTITWAELLPLLRSDSPVARMLRERGLWKQQKPR
jgi:hypothetical protein